MTSSNPEVIISRDVDGAYLCSKEQMKTSLMMIRLSAIVMLIIFNGAAVKGQTHRGDECQRQAQDYAAMIAPSVGGALFKSARNGVITSNSYQSPSNRSSSSWMVGDEHIERQYAYQNAYRQAYEACYSNLSK